MAAKSQTRANEEKTKCQSGKEYSNEEDVVTFLLIEGVSCSSLVDLAISLEFSRCSALQANETKEIDGLKELRL